MPLNIKDPRTEQVVRDLAAVTGETITEATRRAAEERLVRERVRRAAAPARAGVHAIIDRARSGPRLDDRTDDEVLGYGVDGLPG